MHYALKYVIELVVTVFVTAYILPPAITAIYNATTTTWNSAVVTMFNILLPILVIIGIALALMPPELKSKAGL
jgi:hypothetical protein